MSGRDAVASRRSFPNLHRHVRISPIDRKRWCGARKLEVVEMGLYAPVNFPWVDRAEKSSPWFNWIPTRAKFVSWASKSQNGAADTYAPKTQRMAHHSLERRQCRLPGPAVPPFARSAA